MLKLEKYSFGLGDRFAQQGKAQLRAIMKINENLLKFNVTHVGRKSRRAINFGFVILTNNTCAETRYEFAIM